MSFSVKEISRFETAIDVEIQFVKDRLEKIKHDHESIFNTVSAAEAHALGKFEAAEKDLLDLIKARFMIRRVKGEFNSNKIDDITSRIAEKSHIRDWYQDLLSYGSILGVSSTCVGTRDEIKYRPGLGDTAEDTIRNKVKQLNREIQSLKDSAAGINNQGVIDLPRDVLEVLDKYSLK